MNPWDLFKANELGKLLAWLPIHERPLESTDLRWMEKEVESIEQPFVADRDLGDESDG